METAVAPQKNQNPMNVEEVYFIHSVDGKEVEAIRIGLRPDGSADLSGLAGKRDDLRESLEKMGIYGSIGPNIFPKDGKRFLKALIAESRRSPYIVLRLTPELR